MIKRMELDNNQNERMIATSPSDYVDLVIQIASKSNNQRNKLREIIKLQSNKLFNDYATIRDWELFLETVVNSN